VDKQFAHTLRPAWLCGFLLHDENFAARRRAWRDERRAHGPWEETPVVASRAVAI
jgi:hypothetical protein